jgi:iron complex outermembrane recepter protein
VLAGCSLESLACAADDTSDIGLQEIVVTAERRSENMQTVPITIQALTGEALSELNVATFDDYVKYLPNVSVATYGPGQGEIYMRGLATGTQDRRETASTSGT